MPHVSISIDDAKNIGARFVKSHGTSWIKFSLGDYCHIDCFSDTDDHAARFEAIALAISAVNAEFDAKADRAAARADAESAFTIAAE